MIHAEAEVAAIGGPSSLEAWDIEVAGAGCLDRDFDEAHDAWALGFAADEGAAWTLRFSWGAPAPAVDEAATALLEELAAWFAQAPVDIDMSDPAHPDYDPRDYWRGPSWIVTNAFAIWGLENYGLYAEAERLRSETLALIAANATTYEYYDSQTGEGLGAPDFMWTGVFYLLLSGPSPLPW